MQELHRKTYRLIITISRFKHFNKKIVFRYKQGTIEELLEMINWCQKSNDFTEYLFYFLNNKTLCGKITKRQFNKITEKDLFTIYQYMQKTFGKGYFDEANNQKEPDYRNWSPLSSIFATFCKELSISINEVLQLTWEQFDFLLNGLSWNCRAMTKKGQKENEIIAMRELSKRKFGEVDIEETKDLLNKHYENFKKRENATR